MLLLMNIDTVDGHACSVVFSPEFGVLLKETLSKDPTATGIALKTKHKNQQCQQIIHSEKVHNPGKSTIVAKNCSPKPNNFYNHESLR